MIRRQVFHTIGFLIALLGLSMIFSIAWSIYYASNDLNALLKSSVISITFGLILFYFCKDERKDNNKKAYLHPNFFSSPTNF